MIQSPWKKKYVKRITLTLSLLLLLSIALYLPLAYLDTQVSSNVAFQIDYLTDAVNAAQQLVSLFAFAVTYAVFIYALFSFGAKQCIPIILISLFAPILKNVGNFLCSGILSGFPAINSLKFYEEISFVAYYSVLEIVQHLIIFLAIYLVIRKIKKLHEMKAKAVKKIGAEFDERNGILPFDSLYSKKNPLQKSALISAVLISVGRVLMRFWSDLFLTVEEDQIFIMIVSYALDILIGVIFYFAVLLLIMCFDKSGEKLKAKIEE